MMRMLSSDEITFTITTIVGGHNKGHSRIWQSQIVTPVADLTTVSIGETTPCGTTTHSLNTIIESTSTHGTTSTHSLVQSIPVHGVAKLQVHSPVHQHYDSGPECRKCHMQHRVFSLMENESWSVDYATEYASAPLNHTPCCGTDSRAMCRTASTAK